MTNLQFVLRLNAASCALFGLQFFIAPSLTAQFLGHVPSSIILIVGIILVVNAGHLSFASLRTVPIPNEIIWFSIADLLWWGGSMLLLATQTWITSHQGIIAATLVAIAVAGLGLAQLWLLGRAKFNLTNKAYWRKIGGSWMALPNWVKVWLIFLNILFLAAFLYIPSQLARIVLISYVSSGPFLLGFVFFEGGFSRILGIGHLIPWLPMMVWLLWWITRSDPSAPGAFYAVILAIATATCLVFDMHDIRRWIAGERKLMGD